MARAGLADDVVARIQGRLLAGEKIADVAVVEEVSFSSVLRIKHRIPTDVLEKMDDERVALISDLIMTQLEVGVEASISIAMQAQNEDWRDRQTAQHLATFYGVVTDKSIRLLEASEAAALAKAGAERTGIDDATEFSN